MADKTVGLDVLPAGAGGLQIKYHDNGDGTFSEQVYSTGAGGGGSSLPATTNVSSAAYEKSHVIKASAGRLYSLTGYNSGVSQFYQMHDSSTLPADTAVPACVVWVAAGTNFSFDYGDVGRPFTNGIVICNSSTGPTKTIGATADSWFDAQIV